MKPRVYIETSIISYLTARTSRDLILAAHQEITNEWWESRKKYFDLYISQLVVQEAGAGDTHAAEKRLNAIELIPLLELNDEIITLANTLLHKRALPKKAVEDALHIALATYHGMDYLLTWNCKHIANAEKRYVITKACHKQGIEPPVICTPEELMGG